VVQFLGSNIGILNLYDALLNLKPSPVYELNRAIVLAKIRGPEEGIHAIMQISDCTFLDRYHLVHATLGQLYAEKGEKKEAREAFEKAIRKTSSPKEKDLLKKKLEML
jgi:RNA polymerase sigma-70 factor (ECF subfamily)